MFILDIINNMLVLVELHNIHEHIWIYMNIIHSLSYLQNKGLIFCSLLTETSALIVHCIGNLLLVRPKNQQRRQLEEKFYSSSYISQQDQVDYSSDDGTINYINYIYSLHPMVLTNYFSLFGLSISLSKNIFIFKCGC